MTSAPVRDLDRATLRVHRVAALAKRLLAAAPFYDAGLPMEHRPLDVEGCEGAEPRGRVSSRARPVGASAEEYSTLHQLEPEALHQIAPRLVARAWRRLIASGPSAEVEWHRGLAMEIVCIADTLPREVGGRMNRRLVERRS